MTVIVNLTSWEYQHALQEAYYRHRNWKGGHSYQHTDQREANVLGVCGEAAAAKYLGLNYVRGEDWQPGTADLGHDIEVKTTYYEHLIVMGNNHPDRRYVFVVKQRHRGYHYEIRGWAYGWEVMQEGTHYPPGSERGGKHGSYWLDSRMLHPIEELKASLLLEQI